MGGMPKQTPLTEAEQAESARLKAAWNAKRRILRLTQDELALRMGMTQSAVSQYLNGKIRIGNEVLLMFSKQLEIDPRDIRPDIYARLPEMVLPANYQDVVKELTDRILSLPREKQGDLLAALARAIASP